MDEKGISLVEVLASLVVISLILIAFFQLFIQTNKTTVSQNEQLVLMHFANAKLERIKLTSLDLSSDPEQMVWNYESDFKSSAGGKYFVEINRIKDVVKESQINLLDVTVTVTSANSNLKGVVEGYVPYKK